MTHRTVLAALTALCLAAGPGDDARPKSAAPSLNDLSLEVVALQTLYLFKFTSAQVQALRKVARETADPDGNPRPAAKASAGYRKALLSLRDALARADDGDLIADLQEEMDDLR